MVQIFFFYFVQDKELSLLEDIAQMKDITDNLYQLTRDSTILSATTEQAIVDIKGGSAAVDMQTILNQTASSKVSKNSINELSPLSCTK